MSEIKNIIFDLGGVLINIDYNKTINAFKALGIPHFEEMFSQFRASELFEKLETGDISEEDFYRTLRKQIPVPVTDLQIENAWNAILLDFRKESLDFLTLLQPRYNLYLLSNTNSIHHRSFQHLFILETGKPSLDIYFIKAWYSHLIHLRKPYAAIYDFVLKQEKLDPKETLFIDDSVNNIETAAKMGLQTHLLLPEERIEKLGLI